MVHVIISWVSLFTIYKLTITIFLIIFCTKIILQEQILNVLIPSDVREQKGLRHLVPTEPTTKHRALRWRNTGYFIYQWRHPGEWETNAQKLNTPMVCRLQVTQGKITRHCGLGVWGCAGN